MKNLLIKFGEMADCNQFHHKFMSSLFTYFLWLINYKHKPKSNKSFFIQPLYTKAASKMLVKLPPDVNFINILSTHFLYESALRSFFLVAFWLWQKYFGKKALS